ncbi:MAG: DUF429 domain-containing protein [Bacteroidetes bacterium]|jgi:predicted nuclease with RNAse H fold|nr:DUF429 domain-containing protein [Bacteroidota bacterium]
MEHIGIDYGSKMAGTTAIAYLEGNSLHFAQSQKKQDADAFVKNWVTEHQPQTVFLDAPLSLPGVYTQPASYGDYFYRAGDRLLKAMSPMFLGGLTARAMKLSRALQQQRIRVVETYPSRLADVLALDRKRYKKDKAYLPGAASIIMQQMHRLQLAEAPANWHQVDALLAFCSGWRYHQGLHELYGEASEGVIVV